MSRMLKKAGEYEGDVEKVLRGCDVEKALSEINSSSQAAGPPLSKRVIERDKDRRRGGKVEDEK